MRQTVNSLIKPTKQINNDFKNVSLVGRQSAQPLKNLKDMKEKAEEEAIRCLTMSKMLTWMPKVPWVVKRTYKS